MKLDLLEKHKAVILPTTEHVMLHGAIALINKWVEAGDKTGTPSRIIMSDCDWYTVRLTRYTHPTRYDYVGAVFDKNRRFLRFKYVEVMDAQENRFEFGLGSGAAPSRLFYRDGSLVHFDGPALNATIVDQQNLDDEGELFDYVLAAINVSQSANFNYWQVKG